MNEWMNWFFEGTALQRLSDAAGLTTTQGRSVLEQGLPKMLSSLQTYAATDAGRQHLTEAASTIPAFPSVDVALNEPGGSNELHAAGETLSRVMLGERQNEIVRETSAQTGANSTGVQHLLYMALPLLITRFSRREGDRAVLLPPLLAAAAGTTVAATPDVVVRQGEPVSKPAPVVTPPPAPTPTPAPAPVTHTTTTTTPVERKGGIPWWVWLLPLLLLGGCWANWAQNNNRTTTTTQTTTTTAATTDAGGIVVTNPQSDSNLPPQPFTMSGTADPNMSLVIEDEGQTVAEATADAEGNWTAELPAPTVGEHTYSVIGGENIRSEFKVNIVDEAAESTDTTAVTDTAETTDTAEATTDTTDSAETTDTTDTVEGAEGTDTETGTEDTTTEDVATEDTATEDAATEDTGTTETPDTASGTLAITEPASGAEVPATGFNLSGTGEAGQTYELLEDGTSVGTFTAGDDGTWTADVAAPAAGDKTYTIRDSAGNEVASLPVTVAEAEANTGECSEALTVSLSDGETVTAPFRFGGLGSGTGYTVAVRRDGRLVGTKEVPVGAGCTWSYTSDPGGRSGTENEVIYEVRGPDTSAEDPAEQTITLNVRSQ